MGLWSRPAARDLGPTSRTRCIRLGWSREDSHMTGTGWNPWKLTAIGLGLAVAVALITGVVVANWSGHAATQTVATPSSATPKTRVAQITPAAPAAPPAAAAAPVGLPSQATIDACNEQAAQAAPQSKTTVLVKDGAIGAVVGAAVGAAGGAIV